jgi:cytochrome c biogenesis protein CcmG/thiol:disulfide interchange protein DsbE
MRRGGVWKQALGAGMLLAVAAGGQGQSAPATAGKAALRAGMRAGMRAPEFVRSDLDGKRIDLASYRGKVVLVDFWATWCAPCLVEIPRLIEMQKRYGAQGFQVIGVSMDDGVEAVRRMPKRYAFDYPVVMGDARLGERYGGVLGLPVQFLVGRDGRIVRRYDGAVDAGALEREVEGVLRGR